MDMKQCSAGHFYDASKFDRCPYCEKQDAAPAPYIANDRPEANAYDPAIGYTRPLTDPVDEGYTVALDDDQGKAGYTVGWLVCVDGPDKGNTFAIHNENNYMGRSSTMDINIPGDNTISRDKPAVITYDNRSKEFYCGFLGGKSIIRLNNRPLISTTQLHAGDVIELGRTKLMFVPLCGENFDWDWDE